MLKTFLALFNQNLCRKEHTITWKDAAQKESKTFNPQNDRDKGCSIDNIYGMFQVDDVVTPKVIVKFMHDLLARMLTINVKALPHAT